MANKEFNIRTTIGLGGVVKAESFIEAIKQVPEDMLASVTKIELRKLRLKRA